MGLRGNAIGQMPLPAPGKLASTHGCRLLRDVTIHAPIAQAVQWNMLVASMKSVGDFLGALSERTESPFSDQKFLDEVLRKAH